MMDRFIGKELFLILIVLCVGFSLKATQLPEGFAEIEIASELDPTALALAPDGRVFIAEKNGQVLIVRDGEVLPDPFLKLEVDNYNERGLQSIAIHPDFETNNYIYFFYMAPGDNFNRVTRWTANGDFAIPGSEVVLYEMDISFGPNHNGGGMQFGADGKLYIATGDGVVGQVSQSKNHTNGKIHRLNDDGSIPDDNPFYTEVQGKDRSIWSLGLRNPFTLAVQPNTGRMFFCDVGQSLWEEINEVEKGANFGWPQVEGFYQNGAQPQNYRDPILAYGHDPDCAIVGGTFYNPSASQFPAEYVGQFFFMDYCEGYIKVMNPDNGIVQSTFATDLDRPIALLVDHEGAMYYLARAGMGGGSPTDNTSSDNGRLMKIIYTGSGAPFIAQDPASILVPQNESVNFTVNAFGAETLQYQWLINGLDVPGATSANYLFNNTTLADDGTLISCRVTNDQGTAISEDAILNVTSGTRPQPTILTPQQDALYKAGDIINFSGTGFDNEDGSLTAAAFEWRADFHHLDHVHPAMSSLAGVTEGSFEVPRIGEISDEVWYRVYLTVTDAEGLKQTTFQDINPIKTAIELKTNPPGLNVVVDGKIETTPSTFLSVEGIQRSLVAPYTQERNDSIFIFKEWENGSDEILRQFFAEDTAPLQAIYEGRPIDGGTGLMAEYFDYVDEDPNFNQSPKETRIDPEVNFNWVLFTPYEWSVGVDSFCIRWTGSIIPLFDEEYTFHLNADDGVRLWIDDVLVIDHWVQLNFPEESTGTFQMQKGQFHKIRLEYFEQKNNAMVIMSWSSNSQPKQVIPQGQLFPEVYTAESELTTLLYPNPTDGPLSLRIISRDASPITYSIFDLSGRLLYIRESEITRLVTNTSFDVAGLDAGMYILQLKGNGIKKVIPFMKN